MQQSIFMEKYPIFELTLTKAECLCATTAEIIQTLTDKINAHPVAKFIAHFDHYAHTKSIEGEINPEIIAAQHVVFCFGTKLPNAHVMTVRPRSIGVTEFADKFVLAFLEPPMPVATEAMVTWVKSLQKSS
ncbi:MAG: hypothetical protein JHC38_06345 [Thiotrichales bacterium]|jgi:hypothetical protein|nr:hypothetical protein [Thiotrichales bacterium]